MPERTYREDEDDLNRTQPVGPPFPAASPFAPDLLQAEYRRSLGRDASPDELASHYGNPGGLSGAIGTVITSPEAAAYRAAPPAAAAPPPPAGPRPTPGGGQGSGGFRYTGYDFQQDAANRDPNKSAKYALASLFDELERQGIGMPKTHEDAAAFAQQYIVPGMAKYGYNVRGVDRDRFTIDTRENDNEVIDWLVNAGGENPEVGWQSDAVGGDANQGLVDPVSQLRGMAGGEDILSALMMEGGLGGSSLMERIQAELQKLLAGAAGAGGA